ncbi:hypothetical protein ABVT39_021017 [Epinephelus coioides]
MDCLPTEACLCAALLMVWCVLVQSEPNCDQTEFLHTNGSCVACTVCGPGEQLSEDCGFGDGGEGVCILCEEGKFSADTGVAPCMRCTQCNLLNRLERTACSPTCDAQCGQCLPGYYELRSMTGEVELPCVPCSSHDTVHKECLLLTALGSKGESAVTASWGDFKEPREKRVKEETFPMVLIGSATASSIFLIALLLWAVLLTAERFSQSIDTLDYDSVQDLSLMLDSADSKDTLRRLGRSLGVPPQVNAHLQGFQDLFQYLRTSTYTLLPQLAQAAALLPNPEVVARIHRAVVTT